MEIKNLSQLKKALKEGHLWVTLKHYRLPDRIGIIRNVKKMQTNGFYSGVYGFPYHKISMQNNGKGSWWDFGKAENWSFHDNGICTNYLIYEDNGVKIKKDAIVIQILDDMEV